MPECDIVHLHWIAGGFVDYWEFFCGISPRVPIVWTLHDMNPFTGGCHYDLGCGRFAGKCGSCPQLGSQDPGDLSRRIWTDKSDVFARIAASRLHVVTPSQWLAREVERSSLLQRFPRSVIPYGLDLETFAPKNRVHARELLGLPVDAKIILFVADGLDNRRKGFPLLIEALSGLHGIGGLMLLSVGNGHAEGTLKVPWIHLGPLSQDRMLPAVYSAADIFVIPSLQDNLPNTVLESMASGTPVIGFAVGGIPDMVRPGVSGTLVEPENVAALRVAVEDLLNSPAQLDRMGSNCRQIVEEEYCLERQARRYEALYTGLVTGRTPGDGAVLARAPREAIGRAKES
jgi:glycosyltransferase involved in cell wall biosynthesis